MLPTSSGRATHLENTNTFVALCETSRPMSRTSPKAQTGKAKVSENGIGEGPDFGFPILGEARKPAVCKNRLVHCVRPESGVRYQSPEKSRELCCGRRYWP
jgi:hypothetical protein